MAVGPADYTMKNLNEKTNEEIAREALRLAMHKLPMKARFVTREGGDI